jgi:hypothetical protein
LASLIYIELEVTIKAVSIRFFKSESYIINEDIPNNNMPYAISSY